jgi:colanic acid biosynthesis glycosyl transferase WcaI
MRILFIAHHFQPEPNFFFGLPLAKEFVRRGHEVEVLTGLPNYPEGKIYKGYHVRMLQRENLEGIPVIRTPLYPSHDNSGLRRTISYTSFGLSSAVIGPWAVRKADVAYVAQGPMTVGLPACAMRLLRGIPFVLHIQDLWPDSLTSSGMFNSKIGAGIVNAWCNFVYKRAAGIVSSTPGIKRILCQRGVPQDKIDVVYNWCDDSLLAPGKANGIAAVPEGMAGRFNVVFAGNMGPIQALDAVLNAAAIVAPQQPTIQFVFIGSGVDYDRLKNKATQMGLNNLLFLPRRPISEIGQVLRIADALLVHLKRAPLFEITIPSKVQAYLAAGRPILIAVPGDAAQLVKTANAGLSCEPENAQSIADSVIKLSSSPRHELDRMGRSGRDYYEKELSFPKAVDTLVSIFNRCSR